MSQAPSIPPSLDNIHPFSPNPTQAQMDFVRRRFGPRAEEDFRGLSQLSTAVCDTGDRFLMRSVNGQLLSLFQEEAEKMWRRHKEASQTAAASSQPKTGQGSPTDAGQTQDGASTKAPETANHQE